MEVYYKEEKLKAWRDSCLKSILNNQKRLGKLQDNFNQFLAAVSSADDFDAANFATEEELAKSFDQFVEEQSYEKGEHLVSNFQAFERVVEKAFSENLRIITAYLEKFAAQFVDDSKSVLGKLKKEASD